MTWLKSFFEESPGVGSATRLIALGVFFHGVVLPADVWALLSLHHGALLDMPGSLIGFMAAAGTLAGALFAVNKNTESKTS